MGTVGFFTGCHVSNLHLKGTACEQKDALRNVYNSHTHTYILTHSRTLPFRYTSPYLIILAICVIAATRTLFHTLAGTQDVARVTHTGLGAGPTAGGRFPRTCLLTRVCTGLIVAVGWATQGWEGDGKMKSVIGQA